MTDTGYMKLHELVKDGVGWLPVNQNAQELMEQSSPGEIMTFKEVTGRDIKMLRCYFSLLNYIWEYMPDHFKIKVPCDKFYLWLKHLRKDYDVVFEFEDGTRLVEYTSISFSKMSEFEFRAFIKNQMPFIYEKVIGMMYDGDVYDGIVDTIEADYESFFAKL